MIRIERALVKPRVFANGGNEALPLEDEIVRFLKAGTPGRVALLGLAGAGKTTALQHLAAVLPFAPRLLLLDERDEYPSGASLRTNLVIYAAQPESCRLHPHLVIYRLAAWTRDEIIEYLLAAHKKRCAAVMARVHEDDYDLLDGAPELWRIVLDRLANDDALPDVRRALHHHLEAHLCDTDVLERARSACLNAAVAPDKDWTKTVAQLARPGFAEGLVRVLRHPAAQVLLAAERIAADLHGDGACDCLATHLPRELVRSVASFVAQDRRAREHLYRLLEGPSWSHAMSASLLHAAGVDWAPPRDTPAMLGGAYLDGIRWPAVDLTGANLAQTDLSAADLLQAKLTRANARRANLSLQLACTRPLLEEMVAIKANLSHADLS